MIGYWSDMFFFDQKRFSSIFAGLKSSIERMTIDNKKKAFQVRIRSLFLTMVVTLLIVLLLTSGWFDSPLLGLTKYHYTIIVASIYLCIGFYNYLLNLNYIFYNDDGGSLIFRYSSLRPLTKFKKSVQIPKQKYAGFEISKTFFGLKKRLILYQKVNNAKAKYPPVSITSLTRNEMVKLASSLRKYSSL